MTKLTVAAGLALGLTAGSAFAADLPSRKGPPAYIPPAPVFTWTGLYGGVNIGYGFGNGDLQTGSLVNPPPATPNHWSVWSGTQNLEGVLGGGQVGYNYQFSPWLVIGVEADIQAADIYHQQNMVGPMPPGNAGTTQFTHVNSTKSVDWFGTVRGRIGVTFPGWSNVLIYGTGGFAYGGVDHTVSATEINSGGSFLNGRGKYFDTATGWAAGGGVEWSPMSFPAWSLKVEYLYTDLGSTTIPLPGVNAVGAYYACCAYIGSHTSPTRWHTVRAGLNWHFNPFAPAPVLASY